MTIIIIKLAFYSNDSKINWDNEHKEKLGKATQFFILLTILFWRLAFGECWVAHNWENTVEFCKCWLCCCLEWCGQHAGPGRRQAGDHEESNRPFAKSWTSETPWTRMQKLPLGRRPSFWVHEALPSVWPYCVEAKEVELTWMKRSLNSHQHLSSSKNRQGNLQQSI